MLKKIIRKLCKTFAAWPTCPMGIRIKLLRMAGVVIYEKVAWGYNLTIIEDLGGAEKITVGARATVSPGVTLITASYPNYSVLRKTRGDQRGSIEIGEDAWIGVGSILMPGVKIGPRAIVGAGSVVVTNVPADCTYWGVPARRVPSGPTTGKGDIQVS